MGNDGENKKKMGRWLRPLIFPYDEGEPKAEFLAIKHVAVSGKFADVRTAKVQERSEASLASFLIDLEQSILDDAEGTGGVQKYVIQALDADKKVIGRLTLRYAATRSEDETGYDTDSEPATQAGLTAQLMRHSEALERIDKAAWGNIINTQRLTIESLTEQNAVLVQKHLDMMETVEELTQAKHEREMDVLRESNSAKVKEQIGRTVTALLPAAVKKLTGADIGPITDPDTLSMRELLQTIDEEQLMKLQGILTQDQMISFAALLKGEAEKTEN